MAKKLRIDFTKTKDRSSWNTRQIPAGLYKATVKSVDQSEAQDGTAMLVYAFQPTDRAIHTRLFPYYCKLQQNQLWKLRDLLVAAGEDVPKKAVSIDPEKIVGAEVAIEVEDDSYNGNLRSSVSSVYNLDILDGEGEPTDSEEEEEEDIEYGDEDDSVDEETDDEVFDEDEEVEDDIDDGDIDLDDDDLDDDELGDDELEDEEEEEPEPEPAPKRRVRRAAPTAKKPAAKRTVRRR